MHFKSFLLCFFLFSGAQSFASVSSFAEFCKRSDPVSVAKLTAEYVFIHQNAVPDELSQRQWNALKKIADGSDLSSVTEKLSEVESEKLTRLLDNLELNSALKKRMNLAQMNETLKLQADRSGLSELGISYRKDDSKIDYENYSDFTAELLEREGASRVQSLRHSMAEMPALDIKEFLEIANVIPESPERAAALQKLWNEKVFEHSELLPPAERESLLEDLDSFGVKEEKNIVETSESSIAPSSSFENSQIPILNTQGELDLNKFFSMYTKELKKLRRKYPNLPTDEYIRSHLSWFYEKTSGKFFYALNLGNDEAPVLVFSTEKTHLVTMKFPLEKLSKKEYPNPSAKLPRVFRGFRSAPYEVIHPDGRVVKLSTKYDDLEMLKTKPQATILSILLNHGNPVAREFAQAHFFDLVNASKELNDLFPPKEDQEKYEELIGRAVIKAKNQVSGQERFLLKSELFVERYFLFDQLKGLQTYKDVHEGQLYKLSDGAELKPSDSSYGGYHTSYPSGFKFRENHDFFETATEEEKALLLKHQEDINKALFPLDLSAIRDGKLTLKGTNEEVFFLNSPRGRYHQENYKKEKRYLGGAYLLDTREDLLGREKLRWVGNKSHNKIQFSRKNKDGNIEYFYLSYGRLLKEEEAE